MSFASLKLDKSMEYHQKQVEQQNGLARWRDRALFTLGGIFFLASLVYLAYSDRENSRWSETSAQITSHAPKGKDTYHISYTYRVGGATYQGQAELSLAPGTEYVSVLYEKSNPSTSRIGHKSSGALSKVLIAFIIGGLFTVAPLIIRAMARIIR